MIELRNYQKRAAEFFADEASAGGEVTLQMPTGCGRTVISLAAVGGYSRVAFLSRYGEIREQTARMIAEMGVTNVHVVKLQDDLSGFDAVLVGEDLRRQPIDHPVVIRMG